jgi:hypothetical protein
MRIVGFTSSPGNLPADSVKVSSTGPEAPRAPCHAIHRASGGSFSSFLSRLGLTAPRTHHQHLEVNDVDAWRLLSAQAAPPTPGEERHHFFAGVDKMKHAIPGEAGQIEGIQLLPNEGSARVGDSKEGWMHAFQPNGDSRETRRPEAKRPDRSAIFHTRPDIDPEFERKYYPSQWDQLEGTGVQRAPLHHGHGHNHKMDHPPFVRHQGFTPPRASTFTQR